MVNTFLEVKAMKNRSLHFFFLTILIQGFAIAGEYSWEYRDWRTEPLGSEKYRYTTNGQVVHGNQFGFWVDKKHCSDNVLLLFISTYEKGLSEYKGKDVRLAVKVDDKESFIIAPLVTAYKFTPTMDVALFSNVIASDEFIQDLKKGDSVSFTVVGPGSVVSKFDIKTESFSLSGFSAHHLKAAEACKKGDKELTIAPAISKEQIQKEKLTEYLNSSVGIELDVKNIISEASRCDSYLTADNIGFFKKLIEKYSMHYAIKGHYMFRGLGSDGWAPYPRIEVSNICDFATPLPVTEIVKTDQQVFQMETRDNLLYVMANYDSREYVSKNDDDMRARAVFQIIDISNIKKIKVLGEIVFRGLVPNFTVDDEFAYIANDKELMILDISNPKMIERYATIPTTFDKYFSDDVAVDESHIFVTGNNVLKVIDKKSTKVTQELKFDFRTSDIVVKDNYIYFLGWRNGWDNSWIVTLAYIDGEAKLHSKIVTEGRIFGLKLIDSYLVGREGKEIFHIAESGDLERF